MRRLVEPLVRCRRCSPAASSPRQPDVDYDLLIRGGLALTPDGLHTAGVAVGGGGVGGVGPQLGGRARDEVDATGLHMLPGGIDMHVHCDEPGRTQWEGFATAT